MPKRIRRFLLFSLSFTLLIQWPLLAQTPTTTSPAAISATDASYTRYRQQGDAFFAGGRYEDARRQYRNCLEEPLHEEDAYAKQRIALCSQLLAMIQRADSSGRQNNAAETATRLANVLTVNPTDPLVNGRLADLYLSEGNVLFQQKLYEQAKTSYGKGITYARAEGSLAKQSTLELQIRNSDEQIALANAPKGPTVTYYTPKRAGLKVALGLLAVGSGYYAYTLRNEFKTQLATYNTLALTLDPDGDGIINTPDDYQRYSRAYTDLETARNKQGLYVACLSVAAVATLADLYLFIKKAKPRQAIGWHMKPASGSYGLAVGYRF